MKQIIFALLFVTALTTTSCAVVRKATLFHDTPMEEALEGWIKDKTGIDADLTGDSPEK